MPDMTKTQKINGSDSYGLLLWATIGLGIIIRVVQFLANRALWIDEAAVASSLVSRSYSGLFLKTLDYKMTVPLGFLIVERFFVQLFGTGERALRLFPLLAGIGSLFLFFYVAKRILHRKALLIAMLLFAVSNHLVYYSSELKQYSTDVAIILVIFLVSLYILDEGLSFFSVLFLGIFGGLAIWFSHPAIFFLAGAGSTLAMTYLVKKRWKETLCLLPVFMFWLCSFTFYYIFVLKDRIVLDYVVQFWDAEGGYMPLFPKSVSDISWFPLKFEKMFRNPGGFKKCILVIMFLFVFGYVSLFRERKDKFWLLVSPLPFALIASGLFLYPFSERLILYLVPIILLGVAEGTEKIRKLVWNSSAILGFCIILVVLYYPLLNAGKLMIRPFEREEIKPLLSYLAEHRQDEDVLYLSHGGIRAFKYYNERYELDDINYVVGIPLRLGLQNLTVDFENLKGNKRVWLLFRQNDVKWDGVDFERFSLYYLDRIGKRTDTFKNDTASLYLYDLTAEKASGIE